MKNFLQRLFAYFATFVVLEMAFRVFLIATEFHNLSSDTISLFKIIVIGFFADLVMFLWVLPLLLILHLFNKNNRLLLLFNASLYSLFLCVMIFYTVSQYFFWDELTCRFNFIAVDYLVYSKEVIGNIKESYSLLVILPIIGFTSVFGGYLYYSYFRNKPLKHTSLLSWKKRVSIILFSILSLLCIFFFVSEERFKCSSNRYNNEIAKNGMFSLFSAFFNNHLGYKEFYLHDKDQEALDHLREILEKEDFKFIDNELTHRIISSKSPKTPNIIIITVESLSADYLTMFGNKHGLTPNLDKIIKESLVFTNVYATGTRTVYGLSAISLSMPPIPGNSIVRRPNNGDLFSLASVFNSKGYESKFIYGGFGYFDNMNAFFGSNGYQIIDRSSFSKDKIVFSNVWGVSDEDLLNKVIKESDESFAHGKLFFNMVMTTSNHRPFTYPDNRIDIQSGKGGRHGGVKYTDYAIGKFIAEAKTKPWFNNTIFIIVADHTAGSAGRLEVTPQKHHIPMIFYAPSLIKPMTNNILASQIDLAPTLLGIIGANYDSRFYGHDLLNTKSQRAFIASYQYLGLLKPNAFIILKPMEEVTSYKIDGKNFIKDASVNKALLEEAIAYFQTASNWQDLSKAIN